MGYLKFFLIFLLWRSILVADGIIRPNASLSIVAGEGFIIYLEVPEDFGEIKNCYFQFRDRPRARVHLDDNKLFKTIRDESVFPYERNICGIRVSNLSSSSNYTWALEAESINGSTEKGSISLEVLPPSKINIDTRVQLKSGKSTVKCSKNEYQTKHCKIVNILNNDIYHQCELHTRIYPNSMFECHMYNMGRMDETRERILVDKENTTLFTNATQTNLENSTILACEFPNTVISCQAEMPGRKKELLIMDGLYNGRYSAYNTITAKSTCNFEIPKPFRDTEVGLWRIVNYNSMYPTGCLFYVGETKHDVILTELSDIDMKENIKVYKLKDDVKEIDEITCFVPFVISDCYLRSPNNTIYYPSSESFKHQRLIGMCSYYDMPVIAGTWICGSRGRDYDKEILQNIKVVVKSRFGETLTKEIKARPYDTVKFMCKSPFGEPISHCAYVDPQGNAYLVATANTIKTKGHVQYYGRGVNKGECGIKVSDITRDDFGQWKCQLTTYSEGLQSSFVMELKESEKSIPTYIWICIGISIFVILFAVAFAGTLFYRRWKLRDGLSINPDAIGVDLPVRSVESLEELQR